ncbi:MAG TPA: alpha/beta hydrolase [Steroidobacteraceae bacterium]
MSEDRSILTLPSRPADRQVRYGDDPLHIADVWTSRRDGERALLVLIHGGFWRPQYDRTHLGPMANALADEGYTVAAVEYRRVPGSPDLIVSDVRDACERVPVLLHSHAPTVVIGHSAGGHLALYVAVASSATPAGVVALAPVASLVEGEQRQLDTDAVRAFLGTSATERSDLDPCALPAPRTPVIIVHGTADQIVPIDLSRTYCRRHPQTRLVALDQTGHFAVIDPRSSAWTHVLAAIEASYAHS